MTVAISIKINLANKTSGIPDKSGKFSSMSAHLTHGKSAKDLNDKTASVGSSLPNSMLLGRRLRCS